MSDCVVAGGGGQEESGKGFTGEGDGVMSFSVRTVLRGSAMKFN